MLSPETAKATNWPPLLFLIYSSSHLLILEDWPCGSPKSARKIDNAHVTKAWMGATGDPGGVEGCTEGVYSMPSVRHPVVNDQLHDQVPGTFGAITDVFADLPFPFPVPLDPFPHPVALPAGMAGGAGSALFLCEFFRCRGEPIRPGEWRQGFQAGEGFDRLINSTNTLAGLHTGCAARQHVVFPPELSAELAEKVGIGTRFGTSQIDLRKDLHSQAMIEGSDRGGKREEHAYGYIKKIHFSYPQMNFDEVN
jgi:hypothetical protein